MSDSDSLSDDRLLKGSEAEDTEPTRGLSSESSSEDRWSSSLWEEGPAPRSEKEAELAPVPEGSVLLDADLCVASVDDSFLELFDVSPDGIEGRSVFEIKEGLFDRSPLRALLEEASGESRVTDDLTIERDFEEFGHCELRFEARPFAGSDLTLLTIKDLTERRRHQQLTDEQARLMARIASGAPLQECLSALCEAVPRLSDGARASILLADEERDHFTLNVAPDLGSSFGEGLEGAPINDLCIGTCGEAVFSGEGGRLDRHRTR